ncbi:MAG: signal recognition particle-docking protein FtsY, partial [Bacteroidales bacterium]|nr:signal recognition particle-docking protein FtsY [Bacteroidales bacterium]
MDEVIESYEEITDELFDELEEILIMGDVGMPTAERIIRDLKSKIENDRITDVKQVRETMKDIVSGIVWGGSYLRLRSKPSIILMIGVNGVGKTTTIGKLAYQFKQAGNKVVLGAADTFRAAAIEQLEIWGKRVDVPVVKQQMGSDPASVAFDTVSSAKAQGADVVIIDTAGRLHNKVGLMNELTKIKNVMKKVVPSAPNEVLLVLDGSTGQNAFEQAKQFVAATDVNQLAITKLDGTAKGGVVIGISDGFRIPVKYIGLGEGIEDLQIFRKREFVDSLFKK